MYNAQQAPLGSGPNNNAYTSYGNGYGNVAQQHSWPSTPSQTLHTQQPGHPGYQRQPPVGGNLPIALQHARHASAHGSPAIPPSHPSPQMHSSRTHSQPTIDSDALLAARLQAEENQLAGVPGPAATRSPGFPPTYTASTQPGLPDLSNLSINEPQIPVSLQPQYQQAAPGPRVTRHLARCDGCGADPLRGTRWHCQQCQDEDFCDGCKSAGIRRNHPLVPLEVGVETHENVYCDGCAGSTYRHLYGPRYQCEKHTNKDWCEKCVTASNTCGGPFLVHKTTEVGKQIEQYGGVSMPPAWLPYLQPPTGATYNVEREDEPGGSWLDAPDRLYWFSMPQRDRAWEGTQNAAFKMYVSKKKGHFMSDHEFDWVMKSVDGKRKLYSYARAQDRHTNRVKNECLLDAAGHRVRLDFTHSSAADQLAFSTADKRQFRWVTSKGVSTVYPERWDSQRYALFETGPGGAESIVADFTWFDGHVDTPEDLLTIRSANVDHALVVATLNVVHDHQWVLMMQEYVTNEAGVKRTQASARLTPLGRTMYFMDGDGDSARRHKRNVSSVNWKKVGAGLETANNALDVANAAASISGSDGGGGGAF